MARAALKENIAQVTSPTAVRNAVRIETVAASLQNAQNDAVFHTRLARKIFERNEPLQEQLEAAEFNGNPNIDPRRLLKVRNPAFQLNHVFDTQEDKDVEEAAELGMPKTDYDRMIALAYIQLYEPQATYEHSVFAPTYTSTPAPGYTARESVIGNDGKHYTAVYGDDNKIAYYDNGVSCSFNKGGPASTISAVADLRDDAQHFNIQYRVDAKGNVTQRSVADSNFQAALVDIDNRATKLPYQLDMTDRIIKELSAQPAKNDPVFKSAIASGITTPVAPTEPFSAASLPSAATSAEAGSAPVTSVRSVVLKDVPTLPSWARPTASANAPSLEPSI